ncbi:hypothetical protein ACLOJK_003968 [Asimina triloba]
MPYNIAASADVAEEGENMERQIDNDALESMALEDLEEFKDSFEELRKKIQRHLDEISIAS